MKDINGAGSVLFADLAMLAIAVMWGAGYGVTNWLLGFMSPIWLLAVRFGFSGLALWGIFGRRLRRLRKKELLMGVGLGAFLAFLFVCHVLGLVFSTPGKQSFIVGANVVMVPFFYALVYRRLPGFRPLAGALITTVGLLVMAFVPGMRFNLGDFFSLLLAVDIAVHVLLVGNFARRMDPLALAVVQIMACGAFLLASALLFEPVPDFGSVGSPFWGGIVFVVFVVTVIPLLVQAVAQRHTPETHAAIIMSLEGPFGYVIAVLMGQEILNLQLALGGFIILLGVLLTESETFRAAKAKKRRPPVRAAE